MKFVRLIRAADGTAIYFGAGMMVEAPLPKEHGTRVFCNGVVRIVQGTVDEVVREFEANLE